MELVTNKVKRSDEAAADLAYWLSRPMAERIAAVEVLRQQAFGGKAPHDAEHDRTGDFNVQRRVTPFPDAFIEREKLKQRMNTQGARR